MHVALCFSQKRPVRAADHHRLVDVIWAVDVLLHDLLGAIPLLDDFLTIIRKIPRPVEIAAIGHHLARHPVVGEEAVGGDGHVGIAEGP